MNNTDVIIIGSGPGGYQTACHAAKNGLQTVIVEADEVGGTCLNRGCIPTKTLCRNAEVMDTLRHAETFGLNVTTPVGIDYEKVVDRKDEVVRQLRSGIDTLLKQPGIQFLHGTAHFKDAHTIVVNDEEYTAKSIIIATGSLPKCPPIEGTGLEGVLTSTELLNLRTLPKRLCIIGAGVIGMEFASIFNSFGTEVTVVEFLKEALPVLDSDIAKRLRQTIGKRGVEFNMQSAVKSITETKDENGNRQLTVTFEKKGKEAQTDADIVLIATGRKPNTEGLEIEKAGIEVGRQGISVDEHFQTNIEGVYAIGDVNGECMLAHAATFQGQHVINHILGKADNIRFDIMPSAVFTYPEAASVGLSEDSCKANGLEYSCHKSFYRANGKALAMNETDGMLKLMTGADGKILGCHAFGAHSSDMVQEVAALMNSDATINSLADIIHIHPTLAEILHETSM